MLPQLSFSSSDYPDAARKLANLLAKSGQIFERGSPVSVSLDSNLCPRINGLSAQAVISHAHQVCLPVKVTQNGADAVTLPVQIAQMYLAMPQHWQLPPLAGITSAPLLNAVGEVSSIQGYDPSSGLWCVPGPSLNVPAAPSQDDAEKALVLIREAFKGFPFADAERIHDPHLKIDFVDLNFPPKNDESALLVGLLTAVCRPSLDFAPGLLVTAPALNGAGTGKGNLIRAISLIAYGQKPDAVSIGPNTEELDKRIGAELMLAKPMLFLDNANEMELRSNQLASILTERPTSIRILGQTAMVRLNATCFVVVNGNGLSVSEDLIRRFLCCTLDAGMDDPESRQFVPGFLKGIEANRANLLTAALTIWRWGRQNTLQRGRPLGSFEDWGEWVRDPLLALGCQDPVIQMTVAKKRDSARQEITEVFQVWHEKHGNAATAAADLAPEVRALIDPHFRSRQFIVAWLKKHVNSRAGGFVLTEQPASGKWGHATYALACTEKENAPK